MKKKNHIYHIAIGNDKNRNYGIFANGLLAEIYFEDSERI
jgi:hypothetical protein